MDFSSMATSSPGCFHPLFSSFHHTIRVWSSFFSATVPAPTRFNVPHLDHLHRSTSCVTSSCEISYFHTHLYCLICQTSVFLLSLWPCLLYMITVLSAMVHVWCSSWLANITIKHLVNVIDEVDSTCFNKYCWYRLLFSRKTGSFLCFVSFHKLANLQVIPLLPLYYPYVTFL